jgi:glycosyltransferase involved in cell wall biosynthesis
VKIIEAMAHRLPVVSSSLGIEGIDIVPGEHVLTADDAPGFASACVELLTNDGLRRGLVERAWSLYWSRYRMELMEEQIAQVARSIRDENPNEPSVGRR